MARKLKYELSCAAMEEKGRDRNLHIMPLHYCLEGLFLPQLSRSSPFKWFWHQQDRVLPRINEGLVNRLLINATSIT